MSLTETQTSCVTATTHLVPLVMPRALRAKQARVLEEDDASSLPPRKKSCENHPLQQSLDPNFASRTATSTVNAAWNARPRSALPAAEKNFAINATSSASPSLSSVTSASKDVTHPNTPTDEATFTLDNKLAAIANQLLYLELNKTRIRLMHAENLNFYYASRTSILESRNISLEVNCGKISDSVQKLLQAKS